MGRFSWHTLGPLVPIEYNLNATVFLSSAADHLNPFVCTHLVTATSSRTTPNVTKLKSSHTVFLNIAVTSLY